jgi:hypothetical protein
MKLAWGARVSAAFRARVVAISTMLGLDPSDLMSCMAFETGETFRADVRNAAGSGAVGLIQFMPSTAAALGTTTSVLAAMTAEQQLDYVLRYFKPWVGRLKSLGDVYGAILWPGMIGRADAYVVFDKADAQRPKLYIQNAGLDFNKDGRSPGRRSARRSSPRRPAGCCPATSGSLRRELGARPDVRPIRRDRRAGLAVAGPARPARDLAAEGQGPAGRRLQPATRHPGP